MAAVALAAGVTVAVVPASPAAAASPHCNYQGTYVAMKVPMGSGTPYCNMGQGSNSSAVSALQWALNYCVYGYGRLAVDGDFGPNTKAALREVQGWIGAAQDGVYGPETFGKLARSYGFPSAISSGCIVLL
jgi:hypothetical protein